MGLPYGSGTDVPSLIAQLLW
ncbi:hypothetical protein CCACVL1_00795, partial [Corchorus capsularis]